MREENLEGYLQKKLAELDKQKDMQDIILKGKLSFGIDSTTFGHLPAWQDLVKKKKRLVKMVWLNALFTSLMVVFISGDFFTMQITDWWKDAIKLILTAVIVMLFYVISSFYSMFYEFRKTESEVRKLIYQDILFRLKKEEKLAA